jgi:hypothetical protein
LAKDALSSLEEEEYNELVLAGYDEEEPEGIDQSDLTDEFESKKREGKSPVQGDDEGQQIKKLNEKIFQQM